MNPLILPVLGFFLELILLFFLSRQLTQSLMRLIYRLTKSRESTVNVLAFLYLPGTIIHELSHILTAGVLMVHVGNAEFMPEIREGSVKLGSAEIGQTDPFRRALIGLAPVILGIALIAGAVWYVFIFSQAFSIVKLVILLYLLFEVSNTMFSSPKDLEGLLEVSALIISLFIAFYFLNITLPFNLISNFLSNNQELIKKVDLFLLLPIGVDLTVFTATKLFTPSKNPA